MNTEAQARFCELTSRLKTLFCIRGVTGQLGLPPGHQLLPRRTCFRLGLGHAGA